MHRHKYYSYMYLYNFYTVNFWNYGGKHVHAEIYVQNKLSESQKNLSLLRVKDKESSCGLKQLYRTQLSSLSCTTIQIKRIFSYILVFSHRLNMFKKNMSKINLIFIVVMYHNTNQKLADKNIV